MLKAVKKLSYINDNKHKDLAELESEKEGIKGVVGKR